MSQLQLVGLPLPPLFPKMPQTDNYPNIFRPWHIPSAWNLLSPFFRRQVFILKNVASFQKLNVTSLGHRVRPLFLCASLAESWGYTANKINIHQDIQAPPLSDTEDYTVPLFCSQDAWLALATKKRVRLICVSSMHKRLRTGGWVSTLLFLSHHIFQTDWTPVGNVKWYNQFGKCFSSVLKR